MRVIVFLNPAPWPIEIHRAKDRVAVMTDDSQLAKLLTDMSVYTASLEDQLHDLKTQMCGVPKT